MGRRIGVLASVAVVSVGACGGAPGGPTSISSLDGLREVSAATAEVESSEADPDGLCLTGARLGDDPDALAAAMGRYGIEAYHQLADDPVWTDVVDCAEPHRLQVFATVTLADDIQQDISSYADLVEPDSDLGRRVNAEVTHLCSVAIDPAAADLGGGAIDVDLIPAVSVDVGRFTWNPVPGKQWEAGDHTFGCLFEQPDAATTLVADVTGSGVSADQRVCLSGTDFVACTQLHDSERIAVLSVDRAVAAGQVTGERAVSTTGSVDLGDRQWGLLDSVCGEYLGAISTAPVPGLTGVADTYPELYPDDLGHYTVLCSARSPFGTPRDQLAVTSTSVFGG